MTAGGFPYQRAFALGVSFDVRFAPDESALFVVASRLQRWDLATGKRTHAVAWSHGNAIDVSPDGTRVVATNTSGDVIMLDAASMEQLWVVRGRAFGEGPGPMFVGGGAAFVTGSWKGDLVVRDTETGSIVLHQHDAERMIHRLTCSPDRERIVLASRRGGPAVEVHRWPFSEHRGRALPIDGSVDAIALDGRGRLAVQSPGAVAVYDAETSAALARRELEPIGADALAWAPDGELVMIQGSQIAGLSDRTLESRWTLELPYACAAAYSPSGALLALGSWEKGLVARRSDAGVVTEDEPPDDESERVSVAPRDDEEWQIIGYVEIEASEGVVGLEKIASEQVGGVRYDVWDVRCESSAWWAIMPPVAAYDQQDHPDSDRALRFHVGCAARLAENDR